MFVWRRRRHCGVRQAAEARSTRKLLGGDSPSLESQFCSWASSSTECRSVCTPAREIREVIIDQGKLSSGSTSGRKAIPEGGSAHRSVGNTTALSRNRPAVTVAPCTVLGDRRTPTPAWAHTIEMNWFHSLPDSSEGKSSSYSLSCATETVSRLASG